MFELSSYTAAIWLLPRLLGAIYFFAFGALLFQIRGLIGRNGILPIQQFLDFLKVRYQDTRFQICPSLFWINCSDRALMTVTITGTVLSVLLMCGVYPSLLLFLLYVLYLSIVSTGQEFLGFGWEGYLLEITINAFVISLSPVPNLMAWISINLLLARFHFQAGTVKLQSRDRSWRDLTAIAYHYLTQPLPNTQAWYFHKLPMWFQKLSVLVAFFVEIVLPFGIFLGQDIRLFIFAAFFGLQWVIWFTGNFSFLNHLTGVFCVILLNNAVLEPIFGVHPAEAASPVIDAVQTLLGTLLVVLQLARLFHHYVSPQYFGRLLAFLAPYEIANRFGIFAVMTTKRYEIVIEGSDDGKEWKEYTFRYKPSELDRRPRRISPYQPRIDWQAWFLPFTSYEQERWFQSFLFEILKGNQTVLALLRDNPFPEKPPKYIHALTYDYEFTDWKTKRETGNWWKRRLIGSYSPTLYLVKDGL